MRWFRSQSARRWLAAVLIGSLLPALLWPAAQATHRAAYASPADWLSSQLRRPPSPAVEAALEEAREQGATTLRAFLEDFVAAFEARQSGERLADVFSAGDLSNAALVAHLAQRYMGFVSDAVLPRLSLVAGTSASGPAPDRVQPHLATAAPRALPVLRQGATRLVQDVRPFVHLLRVLSSARPLGP